MILLLLLWLSTLVKNYIKNENNQFHYHKLSHHINMDWKLWQVRGGVGERHGDAPYLSNFTSLAILNMSSYAFIYIY